MTEKTAQEKRHARELKIGLIVVLILVAGAIAALEYAKIHAEPILRARVIQTLSTRFNSQVELGEFHITFTKGLGVEGKNLSLRSNLYPNLPPQIQIGKFAFHAALLDLFRSPMHVGDVELTGLVINVPPKSVRAAHASPHKHHGKIKIVVGRILCDDALLVLLTDKPGKIPLQFKIHKLVLKNVGAHKAMHFNAQLVNPKPIGNIATEGNFGPWDADAPRDSHVDGKYSFSNANLGTLKGISGTLSSTGKYSGELDNIVVDGTTDTPNFSVNASGNAVALHTVFHAIVNGTNGNTYLQPVRAHFLDTDVVASGSVVRGPNGQGHDISLDVTINNGRIQDLLQIGSNTNQPVMTGVVQLKTKFDLPTGDETVIHRLRLQGQFAIDNVLFPSRNIQKGMDQLSLRGQGKVDESHQLSDQPEAPLPSIPAKIHGTFSMAHNRIRFPQLVCQVPGATIALRGTYRLHGSQVDFAGHAKLQAHLSSIVGGWKGKLLTPLDPFFAKNGAGTDVPIKITGTRKDVHFGLNF